MDVPGATVGQKYKFIVGDRWRIDPAPGRELGVNAIELLPTQEFAGDSSWGYNPSQ